MSGRGKKTKKKKNQTKTGIYLSIKNDTLFLILSHCFFALLAFLLATFFRPKCAPWQRPTTCVPSHKRITNYMRVTDRSAFEPAATATKFDATLFRVLFAFSFARPLFA
jgi:hypothetical protein